MAPSLVEHGGDFLDRFPFRLGQREVEEDEENGEEDGVRDEDQLLQSLLATKVRVCEPCVRAVYGKNTMALSVPPGNRSACVLVMCTCGGGISTSSCRP